LSWLWLGYTHTCAMFCCKTEVGRVHITHAYVGIAHSEFCNGGGGRAKLYECNLTTTKTFCRWFLRFPGKLLLDNLKNSICKIGELTFMFVFKSSKLHWYDSTTFSEHFKYFITCNTFLRSFFATDQYSATICIDPVDHSLYYHISVFPSEILRTRRTTYILSVNWII